MNAKSIYDKLVNVEGVPSSILTYSDKSDCIIIEVQDYNKSVFKFAQKFFNGYKSVDIDYTNENKTIVWYNEVSKYSDRETIDSITRFYYDMKVKGLVESKKSTRKSIKESHGFDEENEYMFGLSVVTNESLIEDTLEEDGLEVDWDYISKVSSELDYAIERKFAKEIGHVAVEEFHDDNSYNCTFWVRFDDSKANKYMKNLNYFDDYTRGNSTVFMYDVDEILDNEIDKLEKKYDSDILSILRECMTVEIAVPTDSI